MTTLPDRYSFIALKCAQLNPNVSCERYLDIFADAVKNDAQLRKLHNQRSPNMFAEPDVVFSMSRSFLTNVQADELSRLVSPTAIIVTRCHRYQLSKLPIHDVPLPTKSVEFTDFVIDMTGYFHLADKGLDVSISHCGEGGAEVARYSLEAIS